MDWAVVLGPAALVPLFNAGLRLAIPTALAAVGETFCERAGVLNLGLEGMMLSGALASFLVTFYTGDPWLGLVGGVAAGLALGAVKALLSVTFQTEQVINGIAIVLFATGLTAFVYQRVFGIMPSPPRIEGLPSVEIAGLSAIPVLGPILFRQNVLVYIALATMAVIWWLMFRTQLGLSVRAAGENPAATDTTGVNVSLIRWGAVLVSGAMAGMGGAVLILAQTFQFREGITAGRGWIAIALVVFSRWNPSWALVGAFLFGVTDAFQLRIQAASGGIETPVPVELFQALPYLVTIVVMVIAVVRAPRDAMPAALGVPYAKEAKH